MTDGVIPYDDQLRKAQDPFVAYATDDFSYAYGSFQAKPKSYSFGVLRKFSQDYDIARACISVRKNVISQLSWSIVSTDKEEKPLDDQARDEITAFFKQPFQNRSFRDLLHMAIDDLTVLDAIAWYKHRANNGKLLSLIPIDAATIRLRVDKAGLTPQPPEIAYEQVVDGRVVAEYTTDELLYEMQNPRTNTPYGLSPIETLIKTIETALSVQEYNLKYFREGNVPRGFVTASADWSTDDLKAYQKYLDSKVSGNLGNLHKLIVTPHDAKYNPIEKRDEMFFKELELSTLKRTCAVMGVSPSQIGFTDDVNRATAESQEENTKVRSLRPIAEFFQEIFTMIIQRDLGYEDAQFVFDIEKNDMSQMAEVFSKLVPIGAMSIDEVRAEIGLEPIGKGNYIQNAGGVQFLDEEFEVEESVDQNEEDEADDSENNTKKEFRLWRKRALRDVKFDKDVSRPFHSESLNEEIKAEIYARLAKAKTKDDVVHIFNDIEKNAFIYRSQMNAYEHLSNN